MFKRIALLVASTLAAAGVVILPVATPAQATHCAGTITQNGATPQGKVVPTPSGDVTLTATFTGNGPGFIPQDCDISWVTQCALTLNGTPVSATCTAAPGDTQACSVVSCTVTVSAVVQPVHGANSASATLSMRWGCCLWQGGPTTTSTQTWSFDWITSCTDGLDNDSDGRTDYPDDPGCESASDDSETASCPETAPGVVICVTTGGTWQSKALRAQEFLPGDQHAIAGYVNAYKFKVPGAGEVVAPCVALVVDGTTVDPCATAGGEFDGTRLVLVDESLDEPDPTTGDEIVRVSICEAEYQATVLGFGVSSFSGYALCD